jgi:hypothetical protein
MNASKMNVTPEMAKMWLETANVSNRNLSAPTVRKYASDMAAGRWMDTHQNAIAFYEDGILADGQHRLAAIVKSNTAVTMIVAFGLSRNAMIAIDQGRVRSMADVMRLSGIVGSGKYATATVSMMNVIRSAETATNGSASAHEMEKAIHRLRDGIEYSHAALTRSQGRLMSAPSRAAICVGYYTANRDKLDRFADVFCTGMPLGPEDATIITVRNKILMGYGLGGGTERIGAYKMVLKFIKAYNQGRTLSMAKRGAELVYRTGAFDE